jgi:CMP-2-keto-3-deoxyoctulosonic acid synthetase
MEESLVFLLLAKSKSNRLPGKNMLPYKGKPMLQHNLEKCLKIFGEAYVSSDSDEILKFAESFYGTIGIKRGEVYCGETPDIKVYQHAVACIEATGKKVWGVVAVHVDTPDIPENVIFSVAELLASGFDEVMTCHPMTHGDDYHAQANKVYGSVRGLTRERIMNYGDPYKPNPQALIVDTTPEIQTEEDYKKYNA